MNKAKIIASIEALIPGAHAADINAASLGELLREALLPLEVTDITALTAAQLDSLDCGEVVVKVTGNQRHAYIVSYKGEGAGEGICLSYNAAGYGETVSYDRTESGWAYNSTNVKTYGE